MTDYFVYCVAVRIVLFVTQKASKSYLPLISNEKVRGFLKQLFGCDLCLGVWLYTFFAWVLNVNVLYEYGYVPVVSELITGIITSFIVWVFMSGLATRFQIVWASPSE